jgi:hypothetical protein
VGYIVGLCSGFGFLVGCGFGFLVGFLYDPPANSGSATGTGASVGVAKKLSMSVMRLRSLSASPVKAILLSCSSTSRPITLLLRAATATRAQIIHFGDDLMIKVLSHANQKQINIQFYN